MMTCRNQGGLFHLVSFPHTVYFSVVGLMFRLLLSSLSQVTESSEKSVLPSNFFHMTQTSDCKSLCQVIYSFMYVSTHSRVVAKLCAQNVKLIFSGESGYYLSQHYYFPHNARGQPHIFFLCMKSFFMLHFPPPAS